MVDLTSTEQLLERIERTLDGLMAVQAKKQHALATMAPSELEQLADEEGKLANDLSVLSEQRRQLLEGAGSPPHGVRTFRELLARVPESRRRPLLERVGRIQTLANRVKERAVGNWLVTYRSNQHVQQVLEMIMSAGQPAAGEGSGDHGLMIDQTA